MTADTTLEARVATPTDVICQVLEEAHLSTDAERVARRVAARLAEVCARAEEPGLCLAIRSVGDDLGWLAVKTPRRALGGGS